MKQYIKDNQIKTREEITITTDSSLIVNPTEEEILNDGWTIYKEPTPYQPTEAELLEQAKSSKIYEIDRYDNSEEVNSFTINGVSSWFDVQKRADYFQSINSAKAVGRKEVSFFIGDTMLSVDVDSAEMMMNQLQLYANDAANVTSQHKANVNKLKSKEEVETYEYKIGYPEKLTFNI